MIISPVAGQSGVRGRWLLGTTEAVCLRATAVLPAGPAPLRAVEAVIPLAVLVHVASAVLHAGSWKQQGAPLGPVYIESVSRNAEDQCTYIV